MSDPSPTVGLIVGSGFAHWPLAPDAGRAAETPYGLTSSGIARISIGGCSVLCLARHGPAGTIAPHAINYRANVWAMHAAGVRWCIGINVVGAIAPGFFPGTVAVPDQLIDYTWGRENSYAPDGGPVAHVELTEPFDARLRGYIAAAADACGLAVQRGVYGVTQGPRLETAAEIDRLERDGCAMVGMTAMPEAVLARELGLRYAVCASAVNHAAGRAPAGQSIHAELARNAELAMSRVSRVLEKTLPRLKHAAM